MSALPQDNAVFVMDDAQVPRVQQEVPVHQAEKSHGFHLPHIGSEHHDKKKDHIFTVANENHHNLVDSMETVTLSWENVNVYVNPPNRTCCRGPDPAVVPKHVLRDVYGHVKPGTLLAIMGASGSGKTTLLNTLTSKINSDVLTASGNIKVNGVDVGTGIRNISAYVQQDDLFIATMTVKEHLTFRALLRMEREVKRKRRLERVDEVIQELGLQKCQDTLIGNPGRIKGISGGEMRRLSFASEILTNPPLLFCDEPTSGLDSFMAESIVQTLKKMADKGKTVLCTIHQPSSEVFSLFHHVLIMAEGRVAYLGDPHGALDFYNSVGYQCPTNYNPADFFIMTLAVVPGSEAECRRKIENVCDTFSKTANAKAIMDENMMVAKTPKRSGIIFEEAFSSSSRYEATWYQQFGALFQRSWKTTIREPVVIRVRLAQTVILSLLLGLIYLQVDIDQHGVMNINGVLFLALTNMTISNVLGVLNSFPLEMPIFMREYGIGLYRVDMYFLCKSMAELPAFTLIPFIFCTIMYWMVGLYASIEAFLVFAGVLVLVANIAVSFGYLVSCVSNSVTTALAMAPPLVIPMLMFGGFFLNSDSVPVYFIWLEYMSWFKFANELITINQWDNIDTISCVVNSTTPSRCLYQNGQQVIDYLNFDKDNLQLDVGILVVMFFAYRFLALLVLFIKARLSKR